MVKLCVSVPNCAHEQACMSVFMCVVRSSALKVAVVWVMGVLSWLDRQLVQTSGLLCLCSLKTGRVKKIPAWQTQNNQAVNICTS